MSFDLDDINSVIDMFRPDNLMYRQLRSVFFSSDFISQKFAKLERRVTEYRQQKLGSDRDISDLLRCFQSVQDPSKFKAHCFSFDGTPVVADRKSVV